MEVIFLGTGTSTGVPQIGCNCATCTSTDARDKRLRTSVLVKTGGKNLLIDCGPDFRTQALNAGEKMQLDAVLVAHSHYDHVGGFDDLRPFCAQNPLAVFARKDVLTDLKDRIPYCFKEHPYPGVPSFELHEISDYKFNIGDIEIQPLPVWHYRLLINGYRIGKMAYITDAKTIDDSVIESLKGIDTLIINALRIKPHMSHMSLAESLAIVKQISPKRTFLIHISHDMGLHANVSQILPAGVCLAYDGLTITI